MRSCAQIPRSGRGAELNRSGLKNPPSPVNRGRAVRIRFAPAKSRANSGTSLNGPISGFPWCDLLQTEADADADGTAEDGKRGEVDADGIEADQQRRIRERVPRELGIAADLSVDPMTAVAIGAAI